MADKVFIPRNVLEAVTVECLEIFQCYGLEPRLKDYQEDLLLPAFEKLVSSFENLAPRPLKMSEKPDSGVDQRLLDQLTLECAIVLADHKIPGIHHNDSLNAVRKQVIEIIHLMGYRKLGFRPKFIRWSCYRLWVEVARKSGATPGEIFRSREWSKKHPEFSGLYEE